MSNSSRHPAVTTATSALVLTALMGAGALPAAAASNHTVMPGDTLSGIASKHGVPLSAVFAANGMGMNTIIYPGQSIRLEAAAPAGSPAPVTDAHAAASVHTVVPGDTLSGIAAKHGVPLSAVFAANGMGMNTIIYPGQAINLGTPASAPVIAYPAPVQTPAPPSTSRAYTVVSGDTMTGIAAKHGVSLSSLLKANSMQATAIIYVGQRVSVPGQSAAPAPASPAPAPLPAPVSGASIQEQVRATAAAMNVDPVLALAVAYQESGFQQHVVSSAGAIGTMQVMPGSGTWASELVGRPLNLNAAADNITAGVAILKALVRTSPTLEDAIASYYQGQYSVQTIGYYDDTKDYVASVKAHMARFR